MPPRKEPKETVVYPSSKRKAPPFKPLRPSKTPRVNTTESEKSVAGKAGSKRSAASEKPTKSAAQRKKAARDEDEASEDGSETERGGGQRPASIASSDEDLDDGPPASNPAKTIAQRPPPLSKRKPIRDPSPLPDSSIEMAGGPSNHVRLTLDTDGAPVPSQSDPAIPTVPKPLLTRMLHEHFRHPDTKIDKQAMQVLYKYFEVFIRETVARARMKGEGECGSVGSLKSWLEVDDLERVAGGVMLDF